MKKDSDGEVISGGRGGLGSFAAELHKGKQMELLQKRIEAQEDYINGLRKAAKKSLVATSCLPPPSFLYSLSLSLSSSQRHQPLPPTHAHTLLMASHNAVLCHPSPPPLPVLYLLLHPCATLRWREGGTLAEIAQD